MSRQAKPENVTVPARSKTIMFAADTQCYVKTITDAFQKKFVTHTTGEQSEQAVTDTLVDNAIYLRLERPGNFTFDDNGDKFYITVDHCGIYIDKKPIPTYSYEFVSLNLYSQETENNYGKGVAVVTAGAVRGSSPPHSRVAPSAAFKDLAPLTASVRDTRAQGAENQREMDKAIAESLQRGDVSPQDLLNSGFSMAKIRRLTRPERPAKSTAKEPSSKRDSEDPTKKTPKAPKERKQQKKTEAAASGDSSPTNREVKPPSRPVKAEDRTPKGATPSVPQPLDADLSDLGLTKGGRGRAQVKTCEAKVPSVMHSRSSSVASNARAREEESVIPPLGQDLDDDKEFSESSTIQDAPQLSLTSHLDQPVPIKMENSPIGFTPLYTHDVLRRIVDNTISTDGIDALGTLTSFRKKANYAFSGPSSILGPFSVQPAAAREIGPQPTFHLCPDKQLFTEVAADLVDCYYVIRTKEGAGIIAATS